jgi:hypothetical protein
MSQATVTLEAIQGLAEELTDGFTILFTIAGSQIPLTIKIVPDEEAVQLQEGGAFLTELLAKLISNKPPKEPTEPKEPKVQPSAEDDRCAADMFNILRMFHPHVGSEKSLGRWAQTIRKMRTLDKRSHEDILAVWKWLREDCSKDARFWDANVLSPQKLREKWDKLAVLALSSKRESHMIPEGEYGLK